MPLSSLPKVDIAGSTNCITSPPGSAGRTTAVRQDNLHLVPTPLSPDPFTLLGQVLQLIAGGLATSGSGVSELLDQHTGLTLAPST